MQPFWETKALNELSPDEWESLCDGCGKCCLVKLEDEDDGEIYYTNVACRYLNTSSCRCTTYPDRLEKVPQCVNLTADNINEFHYMPETCAYRLLSENKPLPSWHPLFHGHRKAMHKAGVSAKNKVISEDKVDQEDLEDHLIEWITIE